MAISNVTAAGNISKRQHGKFSHNVFYEIQVNQCCKFGDFLDCQLAYEEEERFKINNILKCVLTYFWRIFAANINNFLIRNLSRFYTGVYFFSTLHIVLMTF